MDEKIAQLDVQHLILTYDRCAGFQETFSFVALRFQSRISEMRTQYEYS